MPPRSTRSKGPAASAPLPVDEATAPQLAPAEANPPHVVVLPRHATQDARFASLLNPASGTLSRYYYCPTAGLFEFKKFAAPRQVPRSWLLAAKPGSEALAKSPGYILKDASILMATPLDPCFLLLPLFDSVVAGGKALAKPEDDHFDALAQTSEHMAALLKRAEFRQLLRSRLSVCCTTTDVGGEEVHRPDLAKLSRNIFIKAEQMIKPSVWPRSLEEEHVKKPLEVPHMPVMAPASSGEPSAAAPDQEQGQASDSADGTVQQSINAPAEAIIQAQRLKTALDFILAAYCPSKLRPLIWKSIRDEKWIDLTELDEHLALVNKRKSDVQALRTLSDNISRKRGPDLDDEQAEIRAEKKRKREEEEKKKKSESRATKDLKKVDTSGMKKLSSFFTMTPAAKTKS